MKEYEIECVVKDNSGTKTQIGFKDKGTHSIFIVTRLILAGRISFYVNNNGNKVQVVVNESTLYNESTASENEVIDIDDLHLLPVCHSKKN